MTGTKALNQGTVMAEFFEISRSDWEEIISVIPEYEALGHVDVTRWKARQEITDKWDEMVRSNETLAHIHGEVAKSWIK